MNANPPASSGQELIASARKGARRTVRRAKRVLTDPSGAINRYRDRHEAARLRPARVGTATHQTPVPTPSPALSHAEALQENGFTVFRGAFTPDEVATIATSLKAQAGIQDGVTFTKVDATNQYPLTRQLLFDDRILGAVREAIGADGRFLQISDLHYRHDTSIWHRDSVHRAHDASQAPDWADPATPFGVVKAILYLESDNAAMGIMAGSHLSPHEIDRAGVQEIEERNGQIVIDAGVDPNQRFTAAQKNIPMAWKAEVGDVLVFDERMYHAGRRVDAGVVSANREAPKFTLSLVFGADNRHSERMYSYFRYARKELRYRDLPDDFKAQLAERGLVLRQGWGNFYERAPQDLRHVYLRKPEQLESLIAEFTAAGSSG